MIPGEHIASISPNLISEERWNIMILRPSQRGTRDPEKICYGIWTNVKMDGRISQRFRVVALKFRVNSIRVVKSMIFFNILGAIAPWVTSSWAIVFFALSLRLLPLVYILCILEHLSSSSGPRQLENIFTTA